MPPTNLGARMVEEVQVDVTSLDSAGAEPFSTWTDAAGIDVIDNVSVIDQENPQYLLIPDDSGSQVLVRDRGMRYGSKSADPDSQEYGGGDTTIATYDAGQAGTIYPLNFNPADPTDADLSVVLRVEYHDGTTSDIITEAGGTEQSFENIVDGFGSGDDQKQPRKLLVVINNGDAAVTEDIGATTTEFLMANGDTPNNTDIGNVTLRLEGRR